jgi:UPF0176 protein
MKGIQPSLLIIAFNMFRGFCWNIGVARSIRRCGSSFAFQSSFQPSGKVSSTSIWLSSASDPPKILPTSGSSAVRSIRPPSLTDATEKLQLLSFYRFTPIADPESIRDTLFEKLKTIPGLRGTVYIAKEGINAQFSVSVGDALQNLLETFGEKGCLPFDTFAQNPPNLGTVVEGTVPTFDRLIVRTRDYILRDGILPQKGDDDSVLDWSDAGVELDAKDWDEQLRLGTTSDEKIQLLDCRNTYESDQGTFRSSTPLNTQTFSETWSLLDTQVESNSLDPNEPVYIFCTGGIRCVKVGAYLKQRLGFQDVRSLKHGIIGYERWANDERVLKENDCGSNEEEEDLWVGENFLFDKRRFAEGAPDSEETKE